MFCVVIVVIDRLTSTAPKTLTTFFLERLYSHDVQMVFKCCLYHNVLKPYLFVVVFSSLMLPVLLCFPYKMIYTKLTQHTKRR